jgi:two-component system sensor histidine kinase CpxA
MNFRLPLYTKILGWFFLNLLFLALVFLLILGMQFRFGLNAILAGLADDRLEAVSEVIRHELNEKPRGEWEGIFERFNSAYAVKFSLFRGDGSRVAGQDVALPSEVRMRVLEHRLPGPAAEGRPRRQRQDDPPRAQEGPRADGPPPEARRQNLDRPAGERRTQKLFVHSRNPSRYWALVRFAIPEAGRPRPAPMTLVISSETLSGGGLFFDYRPWAAIAGMVLVVSVLFWFPLVRGITRSISQMTSATAQIAEGRFDVRVESHRNDEMGSLAESINGMAARLASLVDGQKRFLGDIAHELCAPIARLQMALGILEHQADPKQQESLADLREEVQEMSTLVNELLSFSRASLRPRDAALHSVNVLAIASSVVERESRNHNSPVEVRISKDIQAKADPELLARALANLLRNALRYAASAGPVIIAAETDQTRTRITISDSGPGVPESTLPRLFEPFYRPDAARRRETGGAGLGLAIVKSCVEACGGAVSCRNLAPAGFQVEIVLPAE